MCPLLHPHLCDLVLDLSKPIVPVLHLFVVEVVQTIVQLFNAIWRILTLREVDQEFFVRIGAHPKVLLVFLGFSLLILLFQ